MFYERKIKYLDYLIQGERHGNAGFVKIEAKGSVCSFTIQVKGLRDTDSFAGNVYAQSMGREEKLCEIKLCRGMGAVCLAGQSTGNIGNTGIGYEQMQGIRISISPDRELRCVLREESGIQQLSAGFGEMPKAAMAKQPEEKVSEQVAEETIAELRFSDEEIAEEQEPEGRKGKAEEQEPEERKRKAEEQEPEGRKGKAEEQEPEGRKEVAQESEEKGEETEPQKPEMGMKVCSNKWEQLAEIYPHITPFRDEREYLSVGLNDFVILPSKYFRLIQNSFLLHGYYNYNHLVLKRLQRMGREQFYIGVPGNFFEREKQVAVMFGFQSFECREEPAADGDYGYYLMPIEL